MSTIQEFEAAAANATQASSQAKAWAIGPINSGIMTDSGLVPTIAEFIRVNQERADAAINAIGWVLAGDFTAGCTVKERNQYVLVVGGAGYRWDGALPKVVAPGSSPTPIATGSWVLVVGMTGALPVPDVSIPFSTDGRMTHGKGAPVLVGTTPVAQLVTYERLGSQTMIDKSGRLVTVPAGEMAIEQQGLAIFDQSVNLAAPSINFGGTSAALNWANGAKTPAGWITLTGSGDPAISNGSYKDFIAPTSGAHTFSLDILKTAGLNCRVRVYDGPAPDRDITITETTVSGAGSEAVSDAGEYWRVELTVTLVNSARPFRIYPFGTVVGASGSMTYRRVQLEAKPFATPYIENATSAQTTRPATTKCDIPWPGNMQPLADWQELTIAFEFDIAGSPPAGGGQYVFVNGGGVGNYLIARVDPNGLLRFYRSGSATHQLSAAARRRYKMCYRINRNVCDLFVDGVRVGGSMAASPNTPGMPNLLRLGYASAPGLCLNGHLRNINIWNSPLTDAQCVAASS